MIYFKLFLTFLEIGAVSFGGGYGMISLIREAVLSNHWLTESEFINFIAVSESTPGPLAVNMGDVRRVFARRRVGQSARDFGRGAPLVRHYFAHCGSVE